MGIGVGAELGAEVATEVGVEVATINCAPFEVVVVPEAGNLIGGKLQVGLLGLTANLHAP